MPESFFQGYALLIGVGADLPNTVDDARGLADILTDPERCAYPAGQVRLLTGEGAGRAAVLDALDELARQTDETSTVVVYFSGHGYRVKSTMGRAYYLLPSGYDMNDLYETAILGQDFLDKLAAIPAQKLALLLDCCHAGGMAEPKAPGLELVKAPLPQDALEQFARGRGRVAIASCKENERSYAGRPYSAFTLALVEALCGQGAAKKDGYVRVADLALHARQVVPGRTGGRQHPILHFEQADNFILAYYAGGGWEPKGLPFAEEPEIEPQAGAWAASSTTSYHVQVRDSGVSVQGSHNRVVGAGGVMIGGDVVQNIHPCGDAPGEKQGGEL